MSTNLLFRDDPYLAEAEATVLTVNDRRGIVLDRTVFFATGGGQPGDSGVLLRGDGEPTTIATAVYGDDKTEVVHVPSDDAPLRSAEEEIESFDWAELAWALETVEPLLRRGDRSGFPPIPVQQRLEKLGRDASEWE